eukprot:6889754-Pyramimonas_sp.AAC.3
MYYATPFVLRYELRVGSLWRLNHPMYYYFYFYARRGAARPAAHLSDASNERGDLLGGRFQSDPLECEYGTLLGSSSERHLYVLSRSRAGSRISAPLGFARWLPVRGPSGVSVLR